MNRREKIKRVENQFLPKEVSGNKIKKRAFRHNLDGTKQFSLITEAFNMIKKNKREINENN